MLDAQEPIEVAQIKRFTDNHGTVYDVGDFLGGGIEGRVFLGKVVSLGTNADPRLKVGEEVAIKQQPLIATAGMPLERKKEILQREIDLLDKEGSLFGSNPVPVNDKEYMYMAIPKIPGKTLREQIYQTDPVKGVVGKIDISTEEKTSICYQLLKDYTAQQLLGIMHVDIKPDNMLWDQKSGRIKVIDFGNGYDRDRYAEHPEGFQSPGELYAAPENYGFDVKRSELKCSVKADEYAIGMLMATLWTNCCYERDADTTGKGNYALMARSVLEKDILAPDGEKPYNMPEDLWKIIRHLTAIDPAQRPENIFQVQGLADSPELSKLLAVKNQIEHVRTQILSNLENNLSILAQKESKEALANFNKARTLETEKMQAPFERYIKLSNTMDNLRDIGTRFGQIDTNDSILNKKKERALLTAEFDKVVTEMANARDPNFQKMFKDVTAMDATLEQKVAYLEGQFKKQVPQILDSAYEQSSLHAYAELRIKQITNGTHDIATMRIELMNLYGDIIRMAMHDSKCKAECRGIAQMLDSMVINLDKLRISQAQELQGRPPQMQTIPHVLPPMAPVIVARKAGYWQRLKEAYKELKGERVQTQQVQQPKSELESNPLFLSQRLKTILDEGNKSTKPLPNLPERPSVSSKPTMPKEDNVESLIADVPKTFNPLSLSGHFMPKPKPPEKLKKIPETEYVTDTTNKVVDRLNALVTETKSINVDNKLEESVRFAQQRRKDALVLEVTSLVQILVYLRNNPGLTLENSARFAEVVDKAYTTAQDGIKSLADSRGVGDMHNPAYGMSQKTSELFNDMKQDLKPKQDAPKRAQL